MAATTGQITWQAFEQLPDGDGFHREVVEGELLVLPPAKSRHARIIKAVAKALGPLESGGLWSVFVEAGYRLSENPPTWIQPDVSVLSAERARATSGDDYFIKAPELAIEVVSPSETARDLTRKIDLLLAGGSHVVWVIDPEKREVRVFSPDGRSCTRRSSEALTLPELLAGWELPVARVFEE
jgi:Uma2 family endonuclease